jgi:hypothetical protein
MATKLTATLLVASFFGLALAVGTASSPGCATVKTPVIEKARETVDCLKPQVSEGIVKVVDAVQTALSTADYLGTLEKLAREVGEAVLLCAVREVGGEAKARYAASNRTAVNQGAIADRATAYLEAKQVTFQ